MLGFENSKLKGMSVVAPLFGKILSIYGIKSENFIVTFHILFAIYFELFDGWWKLLNK